MSKGVAKVGVRVGNRNVLGGVLMLGGVRGTMMYRGGLWYEVGLELSVGFGIGWVGSRCSI